MTPSPRIRVIAVLILFVPSVVGPAGCKPQNRDPNDQPPAPDPAVVRPPEQARVIAEITAAGGTIEVHKEVPVQPVRLVSFVGARPPKPVDEYLGALTVFPELEEVVLNGTAITDAGLARASGLNQVGTLYLADTRVSDAGLVHLRSLEKLGGIDLAKTAVTGVGLKHLAGLKRLTNLDLSYTPIEDDGLAHVSGLTGLKHLVINNANVSDAGLLHLNGLSALKTVDLGVTRVTAAGVRELQKSVPGVECSLEPTERIFLMRRW